MVSLAASAYSQCHTPLLVCPRTSCVLKVKRMTESALPADKGHAKTIRALSEKLQVPVYEIGKIYETEFDRLARGARIPTYLGVLALSNTRSILREGGRRATLR